MWCLFNFIKLYRNQKSFVDFVTSVLKSNDRSVKVFTTLPTNRYIYIAMAKATFLIMFKIYAMQIWILLRVVLNITLIKDRFENGEFDNGLLVGYGVKPYLT